VSTSDGLDDEKAALSSARTACSLSIDGERGREDLDTSTFTSTVSVERDWTARGCSSCAAAESRRESQKPSVCAKGAKMEAPSVVTMRETRTQDSGTAAKVENAPRIAQRNGGSEMSAAGSLPGKDKVKGIHFGGICGVVVELAVDEAVEVVVVVEVAVDEAVEDEVVVEVAVDDAVGDEVEEEVGLAVDDAVNDEVEEEVELAVEDAVNDEVEKELAVDDTVGVLVPVELAVEDKVREAVDEDVAAAVMTVAEDVGVTVDDTVDDADGEEVELAVEDTVGDKEKVELAVEDTDGAEEAVGVEVGIRAQLTGPPVVTQELSVEFNVMLIEGPMNPGRQVHVYDVTLSWAVGLTAAFGKTGRWGR
jgi:hypothetical protein